MHPIDKKITAIVKRFNLNNYAFSKQIGVTGTTIDSIINGRPQKDGTRKKTKPGYDVLLAIINEFDINPDYLFGKSNTMLRTEIDTAPSYSESTQVDSTIAKVEEKIIYIAVQERANYLQMGDNLDYINSLPSFKIPFLTHGTFRCFEVQGNAMAQTFYDGDLVFGTPIRASSDIEDHEVYVVVSKTNGVVLKRIINHPEQGQKLLLKSDNQDGNFPSLVIDLEDIVEIWKVIMHVSKHIPKPLNMSERLNELERKIMNIESKIH